MSYFAEKFSHLSIAGLSIEAQRENIERRRMSFLGLKQSFILMIFILEGCTTYNPATGRKEFIIIPTSEEVGMGRDIHQKILSQYPLSFHKDLAERIKKIGQRLAQVSDRQDYQYHFYLIEKKELNAFTIPGGHIYIFTGLVEKLHSDSEIAGVLAHEIGHCAARHTIKKFQAAVGYQLIGGLILSQLGQKEQIHRIANLSSDAAMQLIFSAYGRKDEFEADRLGLKYLDLAGFELEGMIKTLEVLEQETKDKGPPLILRTHPFLSDRITEVKKEIEKIRKNI